MDSRDDMMEIKDPQLINEFKKGFINHPINPYDAPIICGSVVDKVGAYHHMLPVQLFSTLLLSESARIIKTEQ